jgi:hypothetical protein
LRREKQFSIRQTMIYVINETILVHTKTLLSDSKDGGNLKGSRGRKTRVFGPVSSMWNGAVLCSK